MVTRSVPDRLVADHALADLHALHERNLLELIHHPVDGCARNLTPARGQLVLDLDGRQRAGLLVEQFEDRPTRAAATIAGVAECAFGVRGPRQLTGRHSHA